MESLSGIVESVVFENQDQTFSVFKVRLNTRSAFVSVTIRGAAPLTGESVELEGVWQEHVRFGRQFQAEGMKRLQPSDALGIERFLASGSVKGIGPSMAKRLVEKFSDKTLEILEFHPQRLKEVEGIGEKKAALMHGSYCKQSELRDLMLFLETHGISGAYAGKIFAKYGSFSVDVLRQSPYRLAREVDGIGFKIADRMAGSLKIARDDPARIDAGIEYALLNCALSGHCCVPEVLICSEAEKLLQVSKDAIAKRVKILLQEAKLYFEEQGAEALLYPPHLYYAEKNVAERLRMLQEQVKNLMADGAEEQVLRWEQQTGFSLAKQQRKAVVAALEHGVFVLTGGPGTGKTTVVQAMIAILEMQSLKVLLGAPTGRAAKRLGEATGKKATTIHRMLEAGGANTDLPQFSRNEDEPLEADVIILDEASMMDISLMSSFLEAVPRGSRVIFVGDVDQLPAIGPGSVLKDILLSGVIPSVRLTEIFRQAEESMIVLNAHAIRCGRMPDSKKGGDFEFRLMDTEAETAAMLIQLCCKELPQQGYHPVLDLQVLSPMHRLECGVENLNRLLQQALNPADSSKAEIKAPSSVFRQGDKVMQNRNNYQKNVFNGDIGFIEEIQGEKLRVRYAEERVEYEKSEWAELQLAYAMSVHKSQGSEYPVVVMPLVRGHHIMLQRNLLYTAVTRAKQKVFLLGSKAALYTAVSTDRTQKRYSLLAQRLKRAKGVLEEC